MQQLTSTLKNHNNNSESELTKHSYLPSIQYDSSPVELMQLIRFEYFKNYNNLLPS